MLMHNLDTYFLTEREKKSKIKKKYFNDKLMRNKEALNRYKRGMPIEVEDIMATEQQIEMMEAKEDFINDIFEVYRRYQLALVPIRSNDGPSLEVTAVDDRTIDILYRATLDAKLLRERSDQGEIQ